MKDILDRQAAERRLLICTGPCCNSTGDAQILLEGLRAELLLARLHADIVSEASCVRRSCLGKCTGEPLAYVHPEGIWYHRLTVGNLVRILREHVLDSRAVPELILDEDA
jgi:(2Fe-2S) ferredoxin